MGYFRDLREVIAELERRGKLWRYSEPINKDTELVPFYRLQLRGLPAEERRAIWFERPVNARGTEYMSVLAGVYSASHDIHALGLGCNSPAEVQERWHQALTHPIDPVIVESGPVHEEVHTGAQLEELGLEALPPPVEDPGYSCMIRTGTPMLTRDPVTRKRNSGAFNAFFRSRTRMVAAIGPYRQSYQHFLRYRKQGEQCPVAVVIGSLPNHMAAASANVPQDMDEYAAAGGLVGEPMELVRCKTIDLEVPATAEIVIEGWFDPNVREAELPFGEYPGFMNTDWHQGPVINVSAITHRKNPIFTPILVGFTPSDTNVLSGAAQAGIVCHRLRYDQQLPVLGVECPEAAGGSQMCVIRMERGSRDRAWEALEAAARILRSKWFIAVDEDVYPSEPELLLWALTYSIRSPQEAVRYLTRIGPGLDPSAEPPEGTHDDAAAALASSPLTVGLINAMRPWVYPPIALPAKQYMERALELWKRAPGLPRLNLRTPWYSYELGHWPAENEEFARLMAEGEFLKAGELLVEYQTPLTDELAERQMHTGDAYRP